MRASLFALAFGLAATQVMADELGQPSQGRAFWRSGIFPQTQTRTIPPRFTTTYTEGVARKLGLGQEQEGLAEHRLGGPGSPGVAASFEHGAPEIELRWHPGE